MQMPPILYGSILIGFRNLSNKASMSPGQLLNQAGALFARSVLSVHIICPARSHDCAGG